MQPHTTPRITAGDVVELDLDGEATSALVLLVVDETLILDPCDGRTPVVLRTDEIDHLRVFRPDVLAAA